MSPSYWFIATDSGGLSELSFIMYMQFAFILHVYTVRNKVGKTVTMELTSSWALDRDKECGSIWASDEPHQFNSATTDEEYAEFS